MNIDIGPEKSAKRLAGISFAFFCICSFGFVIGIILYFKKPSEEVNLLPGGAFWAISLMIWLWARWRYKLLKKK